MKRAGSIGLFQFNSILDVKQSSKLTQLFSGDNLVQFFQSLFVFSLTLGAIIAVVRLIWAGYLYMGSAEMWSSKGEARKVFTSVVFGTLLLLAIWLILRQINPRILNLDILAPIRDSQTKGLTAQPVQQPNTQGTAGGGGNCTLTNPSTGACLVWQ